MIGLYLPEELFLHDKVLIFYKLVNLLIIGQKWAVLCIQKDVIYTRVFCMRKKVMSSVYISFRYFHCMFQIGLLLIMTSCTPSVLNPVDKDIFSKQKTNSGILIRPRYSKSAQNICFIE